MPRTLANAVAELANKAGVFDRPATPVLEPLLASVDEVARAREHLHGLEEANAITDARVHAYERALELDNRTTGEASSERVLEIARFLAPGWEAFEAGDDELGPNSTPAELEESEAHATAYADELEDKLEAALFDRAAFAGTIERLEAELERIRTDSTVVTLHGEELGRMTKADAEKATAIIQRRLATVDTELGASITIRNLEEDTRGLRAELATAEETVLAQRDRIAALITERDALADDKERALEVIRGHVFHVEELERIVGQTNDERRAAALARVAELEAELEEERSHRPSSVTDELEGKVGQARAHAESLEGTHAADCHCNTCIGAPAGLPSEEVKYA